MRAGKMDRFVSLQRPSVTTDANGGVVVAWVTANEVWASKQDLSGREQITARQVVSEAETLWAIYYVADIATNWRIVHDGVNHEILYIAEIGRREGWQITTKRSSIT